MIQKETGWTDDYLLWGVSWANIQMKLADAPYYSYRARDEKVDNAEELNRWLNTHL